MKRDLRFPGGRVVARIIFTLLLVGVILPRVVAIFLDSLIPTPPALDGPYIRDVYAPVRVSSQREEVEVWWNMMRRRLQEYYRQE